MLHCWTALRPRLWWFYYGGSFIRYAQLREYATAAVQEHPLLTGDLVEVARWAARRLTVSLALLIALIFAFGVFVRRCTPLGRELSRLILGMRALSKCRQGDVPSVLKALRFDRDSR